MRRGFARTLTNLGEAATLSVIACYVIGFIIVNSYLLTYGYIGSSIFKVQYIGAGLLFLVILLLLVALLYPIDWALSRPEERSAKTPSYSYWALSQPEVYTPKTPPRIRQAIIAGPSICMFALWQFSEKFTSADIRIEHETWWLEWLPVAFMIVWLLLLSF